jgi:hypothetical protein
MDAVDEFVLLVRCRSMTDDGHLALSYQLQNASHVGSAHCVIAHPAVARVPGSPEGAHLEIPAERYQQNGLVYEQGGANALGSQEGKKGCSDQKSAFSAAVRAVRNKMDLDRRGKRGMRRGRMPLDLSDWITGYGSVWATMA